MKSIMQIWNEVFDKALEEDDNEDLAAQCADDYVKSYMEQKADFEYQSKKEDE